MSFSLFKDFEQCAKLKEDWQPTSSPVPLLVGNYVHSYFESAESHQSFVSENRKELMTRPTKSNPDGHLRAEFKVADSMIKTLNDDNMFNYFYRPGKKEVIVTGKIDGYWWKGKIDRLLMTFIKVIGTLMNTDMYRLSKIVSTICKWHYIEN